MSDFATEEADLVSAEEWLARYLLHKRYVRRDRTIRPEAFIPHPYPDLSVTRHVGFTEQELWAVGIGIVSRGGKTLYGRADVQTKVFLDRRLKVEVAPVAGNPNHANVTGWPEEKPAQKVLCQEICAAAKFVANPA